MAAAWPLASLTLVLTGACNLRCAYCYQTVKRPGRMSWNTARTSVDRLLEGASLSHGLALTGGEPLLAFPLVTRLVSHVRAAGAHGRAARITILTNGTRLGEAQARFLAAHRVAVRLSIDGAMPAQRARGAWTAPRLDRLLDNLRRRHRWWFTRHVSVSATVTPGNAAHLADSIDYLLGKGIQSIDVTPMIGGAGLDDGLREVLDAQFARLFSTSLAIYRTSGRIPLSMFRHHAGFSGSQAMCGITGGSKIAVDADGTVYGCTPAVASMLRDPPPLMVRASDAMHLGHIADPDLTSRLPGYAEAVRATGLFGPRNRLRSSRGACRRCRYLTQCVVCPLAIASAPGATDPTRVPDFVCAFNRAMLKYRARFPRPVASQPMRSPLQALLRPSSRS